MGATKTCKVFRKKLTLKRELWSLVGSLSTLQLFHLAFRFRFPLNFSLALFSRRRPPVWVFFFFFFPPKGWARAEEVTRQLLERAGSKCWRLYRTVLNINQTHERDLSAARFVFTVKLIQSFCEWVSLVTNVTNGSCHEVCVCLIFLRECCQNVNTAKEKKKKTESCSLTTHWGSFLLILLEGPPNFLIASKLLL